METRDFKGKKIVIRPLSRGDIKLARKFSDFMNSFIEENAQIVANIKSSPAEQKRWLGGTVDEIKRGVTVYLIAEHNGEIVGGAKLSKFIGRQNHVGYFVIMIRRGYRRAGLGIYLVKEAARLAKNKFKLKMVRLSVQSDNKPAIALYKKCGFKKVAVIPKQFKYKGKLVDEVIMLLYL